MEKAVFGGGCFWGVEAAFRKLHGVKDTAAGYMGGKTENPTYKDVCTDTTGHAEVALVEFDPAEISYEDLLEAFWSSHDPTQLNRQGVDYGTQYRTCIFTFSDAQQKAAELSRKTLEKSGRFRNSIVTEIKPAETFWKAEEYHQQYLEKQGKGSCHI